MSKFSGKCDLYDHMMMKKLTPSVDNPNLLVSDEYECFNIFKERTGGVIYQSKQVQVTEYNKELIAEYCPYFSYEIVKLNGKKKSRCKYKLFDKISTLKEINQNGGVFVNIPIYFESIFDLIPYYPYIVSSSCSTNDSEHIVISNQSYPESRLNEMLANGYLPCIDYKKILQNHYIDVFKSYHEHLLGE